MLLDNEEEWATHAHCPANETIRQKDKAFGTETAVCFYSHNGVYNENGADSRSTCGSEEQYGAL